MRIDVGALSWRGRIAIAAILLAIIAMAAVATVAFTAYQQVAWDLVIERDRQLAYLSAARLREELAKYARILDTVARVPGAYSEDAEAAQATLDDTAPDTSVFDGGVVLLDRYGRVRAAAPGRPDLVGRDWSGRDLFRDALTTSGFVLSNVHDDGPDGAPVAIVSVPVVDDRQEFVGVLAGMFRVGASAVSPLYASIVRLRIGHGGTTYVVDGKGTVVYDSDYRLAGVALEDRGPVSLASLGAHRAARTRDSDGNDIIAAMAPVPGTEWSLVTEEDAATLEGPVMGYRRLLYALMVLGMALPACGVALMVRRGRPDRRAPALWTGSRGTDPFAHMVTQLPPLYPGWQIDVARRASPTGASDLHDVVPLPDGRLMLNLSRFEHAAHEAAYLGAVTRAALRSAGLRGAGPADALATASALLCPETSGRAVGALCMILDPTTGELVLADGHSGATVVSLPEGRELALPAGPPIGSAPSGVWRDLGIVLATDEAILVASGPGSHEGAAGDSWPGDEGDAGASGGTTRHREPSANRAGSGPLGPADALLEALRRCEEAGECRAARLLDEMWGRARHRALPGADLTVVVVRRVAGGSGEP